MRRIALLPTIAPALPPEVTRMGGEHLEHCGRNALVPDSGWKRFGKMLGPATEAAG